MNQANPNDRVTAATAYAQHSARQLAQSAHLSALESIMAAIQLAPQVAHFWPQFAAIARFLNLRHPADPRLRELLERAIDHPAVDPGDLVRPITTLALSRPAADLFEDRLLLRMLEETVARDPLLEARVAGARSAALAQVAATPSLPLRALAAIAHQCFNTEYLAAESALEAEQVARLAAAIAATPEAPPHWFAIYAAYRPLGSLPGAERMAETLAGGELASLARRQIIEPLEEARLAEAMRSLGGAAGAVSESVRAQYESNPYPRWIRTQSIFDAGSMLEILRELYPEADLADMPAGPVRALVAGCGTGQNAIATARRFRASRLLAVDLSRASLAYAARKTRELGVAGIEYRQADILALAGLAERFDLVECSGVLHHLEDPLAGWRVLAGLLEPRGVMRIGLYSETGRRHIVRARDLIAGRGWQATPEGIRACRSAILASQGDELLARVARNEDFYSMSGCRDLLFHVQEHRFSLPQVASMLETLNLRFLGFEFPDGGVTATRYRERYPADRTLTDLAGWHQFELEHPDTFARMYQFWVRKGG